MIGVSCESLNTLLLSYRKLRPITNLSKLDAQLCILSLITFFGLTELMEKAFEVLLL